MARLILVRHGETEWNRLLRYQGQSDTELNETGIRQVERVRGRLVGEKIDVIYSSDLSRALKTAEIIALRHTTVGAIKQTPLLREMDFGDFEGLNFDQMKKRYPDVVGERQAWRNRRPEARAPNGESVAQLADRMAQFGEKLEEHKPEETVLVVAHGGSLQVLICLLLGIDLGHWWQVRLSNASVTIMETSTYGIALILLNDVCHLE